MLALAASAAAAQDCPREITFPEAPATGAGAPPDAPRIRAIDFAGNSAVGDSALRRAMLMKAYRFWRSRRRTRYSPDRWPVDQARLCDLYRQHGFVAAAVGPPEVMPARGDGSERWVALRVPVREGPRFAMGELRVDAGPLFSADEARAAFDVRPGPYRHAAIREGLERVRRAYARRGHATFSGTAALKPRPSEAVVDVEVRVQEGRPWFVGRIAFSGHGRTREATLRRQVQLSEGELLDTERVAESVQGIEALGFARVKDVRIVPSPRSEGSADVTFVLERRPILRYGLAGGLSDLEGASFSAELAAVNAFGRAERFSVSGQFGPDVQVAHVSAGQPNLLGSWWADLELRTDRLELEGVPDAGLAPYERTEKLVRAQAWRPSGRLRSVLAFGYTFSDVTLATGSPDPPPGFGQRRDSRLSLSARRDGWDHPWKPRDGLRTEAHARLSGGPLGGSTDAVGARARAVAFLPVARRASLSVGAQAGALRAIDGSRELPFDERYLLGGENQLRGFDARSVGPRDAEGQLVGGTRYVILHAESHVDLPAGFRGLAFADAGRAWAEEGTSAFRVSTGVELRFELPVVRLPVRLIFAANPARDPFHPRRAFKVAIGPLP